MFGYRFRNRDPWSEAPPWAVELRNMVQKLMRMEKQDMTVQKDIADALAKVQADVQAQTTVTESVKAYVAGINQQLADLAASTKDDTTAAALQALSAQIEANTSSDASAIIANTPAAPAA